MPRLTLTMNIFEASMSMVVQVVPLKALLNLSPAKLVGVLGELRYPEESSLGEYSLEPSAPIFKC